jgi:cell fate regulator YaaT (PSP1 superfamily)
MMPEQQMQGEVLVAKVLMPERGVFAVRVDELLVSSGVVTVGTKGRFVVMLDYGEDVGQVFCTQPYDPAVHGDRLPGFRIVRAFEDKDQKILSENETLASAMRNAFLSFAKDSIQDIRIPVARLSFGRKRLFLRYVTAQPKADLSSAQELLKRQFGVDVSLWAMGPRDEVSEIGGLGPCGRVCCCCSWQRRNPSKLAPDRRFGTSLPSLMNGTCGRFKCCLAFERD